MIASDKKWLARQIREEASQERGLAKQEEGQIKDRVSHDPGVIATQARVDIHRAVDKVLLRLADRIERSIENPKADGTRG